MNDLVIYNQQALGTSQTFDTSILAGTKSPNTISQYKIHFSAYCDFAGSFQNAIQPATLARWRQHLYERGYTLKSGSQRSYSVNAINQRLAAIRSVMVEAAQQGYIDPTTAEAFKAVKGLKLAANKQSRNQNARTKITPEEMRAICTAPDPDTLAGKMHRALLATLAGSGLRISEIINLKPEQISYGPDDEGRYGYVIEKMGKNQAEPTLHNLSTEAYELIQAWLDARPVDSEWIFTGFEGRSSRNPRTTPIRAVSAWEIVKRYAKAAGVEHVKPNDFRRFVGTQLAKKDLRQAQKQLGHKLLETTVQNYVLDEIERGTTEKLY